MSALLSDDPSGAEQIVAVVDAREATTVQVARKQSIFKDVAQTLSDVSLAARMCCLWPPCTSMPRIYQGRRIPCWPACCTACGEVSLLWRCCNLLVMQAQRAAELAASIGHGTAAAT